MAENYWMLPEEQRAWSTMTGLLTRLPAALDAQLGQAAGLTLFEYTALSALARAKHRTLRMSVLAQRTHGSLSRLSHVMRRLETQGLVRREPAEDDRRVTKVVLTSAGLQRVRAATPVHDRQVRHLFAGADPGDLNGFSHLGEHVLRRLAPPSAAGNDGRA